MKTPILLLALICSFNSIRGERFNYSFHNETLADVLTVIADEHDKIMINFIYNELDKYRVNVKVNTDDAYLLLYKIIGFNPVSIVNKGDRFYVEALQHGKYVYRGRIIGGDESTPLAGTSVMILNPKDSTVITYGVSDNEGNFVIPCDKKKIIAKVSCVGYETRYIFTQNQNIGDIMLWPVPIYLNKLNLEGPNHIMASDKAVYLPTSLQKKASQTAVDLLRRMAIPQLNISPEGNDIKDVFGNKVAVFINYLPADNQDMQGMKMTDVRRVEYMDYPTDTRFKGEARVLNFIVQDYEYGGYAKVSLSETAVNGFSNNSNVFNKVTYKKLTYDAYVGAENNNHHHTGSDYESKFILCDEGKPVTVTRSEKTEASHRKANEYPITLRATYTAKDFTLRNTLSFVHNSTPMDDMSGELDIDLVAEGNHSYQRRTSKRINNIAYGGIVSKIFTQKVSLDITPTFTYTHRNNFSNYISTFSTPINYKINENVYVGELQATVGLKLSAKCRLLIGLTGSAHQHDVAYMGTDSFKDSYLNVATGQQVRFNLQTKKHYFSIHTVFGENFYSLNSKDRINYFPFFGVNGNFMLNNKNRISAYFYYQNWIPGISLRADGVVQSNEFLYLTGNPELKSPRNLGSNVAYNWVKDNSFNLAVFGGYEEYFKRVATIYTPYETGKALLRDFINNGNFVRGYLGAQINYKLFNNNLQLYGNVSENIYHTTGIYKTSVFAFRAQLQAVYYWKSFNVLASWVNPSKTLTQNSNVIIRERNFHSVAIGWGNGEWNISLQAANFLNKGWLSSTWESNTCLYSENRKAYGVSSHPKINISVAYTIGYGKKIRQNNEIGKQSPGASAIIE